MYETWYEKHEAVFISELEAIRELLPAKGKGIEIGLGTGNFASALKLEGGIEPALRMRERAIAKGLKVEDAIAENLPYKNGTFDKVLIVTVCYFDDVQKALKECNRVLKTGACLVVGFIDRDSQIGKYYQSRKENIFYENARFYNAEEMVRMITNAGFKHLEFRQTLFNSLDNILVPEDAEEGYGEGSFVVIKGVK